MTVEFKLVPVGFDERREIDREVAEAVEQAKRAGVESAALERQALEAMKWIAKERGLVWTLEGLLRLKAEVTP